MIQIQHEMMHNKKIQDVQHIWYITNWGERITPNTNLKARANYWLLLLENGYSSDYDEEKEILRFWKDEEIITIELKGVDKHQPS